jgi:hypothetical protein
VISPATQSRRSGRRRRIQLLVPPTIDLTMLQPSGGDGGTDPLAGLIVVLAWVWLAGVPWLRFCWWLGHRPRGQGAAVLPSLRAAFSSISGAIAA